MNEAYLQVEWEVDSKDALRYVTSFGKAIKIKYLLGTITSTIEHYHYMNPKQLSCVGERTIRMYHYGRFEGFLMMYIKKIW